MSSWDQFEETALPPPEVFYSKLNMEVSSEDYAHARLVWAKFGLCNLKGISRPIFRNGCNITRKCFEAFRGVCTQNYGPDPAHFYTAPLLAWKACLKKTGIRLELLLDPNMLLMFERGIRGGIT